MRAMARVAAAIERGAPVFLWHACTTKQLQAYAESDGIRPPVRGFDTREAALIWGSTKQRQWVVKVAVFSAQALPDHHHQMGIAWFSPCMGRLAKKPEPVPVDFHIWGLREIRQSLKWG